MWTFIVRNGGVEEASPMLHVWNVKSVTLQPPILDGIQSWYLKKNTQRIGQQANSARAGQWMNTYSSCFRNPAITSQHSNFSKYQLVFFHHQQYRSCRSHTNWPNWPPLKKPTKNWQNPAGLRPRVGLNIKKRRPLLATKNHDHRVASGPCPKAPQLEAPKLCTFIRWKKRDEFSAKETKNRNGRIYPPWN